MVGKGKTAAKSGLNVVCFAATKGGVGKTTLATAVAVKAARDGNKVCMIDADMQMSLSHWYELRKDKDNPRLHEIDASREGIELLVAEGWDWVVIDTPPAVVNTIEDAIAAADVVVIPAKTSALDVLAIDQVVELCKRHDKPFWFVLNQVHHQWQKLADSSEAYLRNVGPVLSTRIGLRKAYVSAMTVGKSGPEIDKDGTATAEIEALWQEIRQLVAKRNKATVRA